MSPEFFRDDAEGRSFAETVCELFPARRRRDYWSFAIAAVAALSVSYVLTETARDSYALYRDSIASWGQSASDGTASCGTPPASATLRECSLPLPTAVIQDSAATTKPVCVIYGNGVSELVPKGQPVKIIGTSMTHDGLPTGVIVTLGTTRAVLLVYPFDLDYGGEDPSAIVGNSIVPGDCVMPVLPTPTPEAVSQ